MPQSVPFLTSDSTILWLKVILTVVPLVLLCIQYVKRRTRGAAAPVYPFGVRACLVLGVVIACAAFHSCGHPRSGTFVHYGEMFHYYLGPKYFEELGHYALYDAAIVADAEQDASLADLPFYSDLRTYQNASRATALARAERVKRRFSAARWAAFKADVDYFKREARAHGAPGIHFFLMDHGYNASPVSTLVLGTLTNVVPVTQLALLATLDVLLVAVMVVLVFRSFGLQIGALFSVYFFVNILNDHQYISGGLLRYDWLLCIVAAACMFEKGRHAAASVLLTTAAMLKVFPAVLFYGVGVTLLQRCLAKRAFDAQARRVVLAAGATALVLFALPAVYLGSVVQPWEAFGAKAALHDRGVYVNHLGLRGILLFEPSHLSLERFVATYEEGAVAGDIVRHWQDVKEEEFAQKRPVIVACALLVLACLTAILWKRRAPESESMLWPLLLTYVASYPSHYYYAFLCLLILLFARRATSLGGLVPIGLLLSFNVAALVTDAMGPSPIVFYTLVNAYLFVCLTAILGFGLFDAFRQEPEACVATTAAPSAPAKLRRGKAKKREPHRRSPA